MNGAATVALRTGAALGCALLLAATAWSDLIEKEVSQLRLRAAAHVRGRTVVLADVLDFSQADPRLLAEIGEAPLAASPGADGTLTVSHAEIVRRLAELGVNLARVLVSGALRCQVSCEPADDSTAPAQEAAAPLLRESASAGGVQTLAAVLRQRVADELAQLGGSVEIEFERAGRELLELTSPPFEFAIRGGSGSGLGLREFRVTIRRDGRVQRTVRIGANVKLLKQVLVAARPLSAGSYIRHDSLAYATRIFSSARELGLDEPEQIVGQRVRQFIPAGQMIRRADLAPVDLVRRARPVTVVGGGQVSFRVTGDALDSGAYGEVVRVRLGSARNQWREVRGVVTGVGTVRLLDETWEQSGGRPGAKLSAGRSGTETGAS